MTEIAAPGGVRVDPERRRAWVQGGPLLGALDRVSAATFTAWVGESGLERQLLPALRAGGCVPLAYGGLGRGRVQRWPRRAHPTNVALPSRR